MDDTPFDGARPGSRMDIPPLATDGHGRAALLLAESLIHGLIARSVLTVADAIEIIEVAAEVERDPGLAGSAGDGDDAARTAPSLLRPLAESLGFDLTT